MGGDHGQRAFRAAVHAVLRSEGGLKKELTFTIGEIDCTKDTSEVLKKSLAPHINSGLNRIFQYTRNEAGDVTGDGWLSVFLLADDTFSGSFEDHVVPYGTSQYLKVPIRVFITGDLALYGTRERGLVI